MVRRIHTASALLVSLAALAAPALGQGLTATAPRQLSVGIGNVGPNSESDELVLSPNSGIAAFKSLASNLVPNDNNERADVFVRSADGVITRASVSGNGTEADLGGRGVALSQVAANGTYGVAFLSRSTNLVRGLTQRELEVDQLYLRVPTAGKTFLISRGYEGSGFVGALANCEYPSVVALENGAKFLIAFHSNAENLVRGAIPPLTPGQNQRLRRIFFATLTVATGELTMEAFTGLKGKPQADGDLVEPVLSGLGDQMLFRTNATNMGWTNTGSFVYQVALAKKSGGVELVSKSPIDGAPGLESSDSQWMTFNASKIVFKTSSANIFSGAANSPSLVLYDTTTKKYSLINANESGERGNGYVNEPVRIDPTGLLAVFVDSSDNYLPVGTDTNERPDVFVRDLQTNKVMRVNVTATGAQEDNGYTGGASLGMFGFSSSTATVGFHSSGTLLRQYSGGAAFSVREVYRVAITFPAPALDTKTTIETPPDITPGVKQVILVLKKFGSSVAPTALGSVDAAATQVSYEVELSRKGSSKKLKVVRNRNRVVLRNLTPGQYTVRYRVKGTSSKGKSVTTKWSPSASVTVKKR